MVAKTTKNRSTATIEQVAATKVFNRIVMPSRPARRTIKAPVAP